jgi:hypothetical protein
MRSVLPALSQETWSASQNLNRSILAQAAVALREAQAPRGGMNRQEALS